MTTLEALQNEFGGPAAPVDQVAKKYLGISSRKTAFEMAKAGTMPFPVYKLGSRKSPWMVNMEDLAQYIDKAAKAARKAHNDAGK